MRVTSSQQVVSLLCAVIFCGVPGNAKKKHAPLAQAIFQAKTVYIDNQSGLAAIGDRTYEELLKWGRFRIVGNPKESELVLLLSAHKYVAGYVTNGTLEAQGTTYDYGNGISSTEVSGQTQSTTTPVVTGRTYMTVIDPRNGSALWSDSMQWGRPIAFVPYSAWRSASRGLIKELRNEVEEQSPEVGPQLGSAAPQAESNASPANPPAETPAPLVEDRPPAVSGDFSSVEIISVPDGADITIDGKFVGSSPSTVRLPPGEHAIFVERAGFARRQRVLSVNGGGTIRINPTLEKLPK